MSQTTTMTVRISGALSEFVASNVGENGSYENISEYVRDLIRRGQIHEVKEAMDTSLEEDIHTFDQCLFRMYKDGKITLDEALLKADSRDGLALKIRLSEGGSAEHDPYGDLYNNQ